MTMSGYPCNETYLGLGKSRNIDLGSELNEVCRLELSRGADPIQHKNGGVMLIGVPAFIVGVALAFASAASAENVDVRSWSHAQFGRIVFDWKTPVKYIARVSGRKLTVSFNKNIETSFFPALRYVRAYIKNASLAEDGRTVRFTLADDFELRNFKNDNAIVLDLRRKQSQQSGSPTLGVRVEKYPTYTRIVFDWKQSVGYSAALGVGRLRLQFDKLATVPLALINREFPQGFGAATATNGKQGLEFNLKFSGKPRLRHFRSGTKVIVDLLVAAGIESKPPGQPKPEPKKAVTEIPIQGELLEVPSQSVKKAKRKQASSITKHVLQTPAHTTAVAEQTTATPKEAERQPEMLQKHNWEGSTNYGIPNTVKKTEAVAADTVQPTSKPDEAAKKTPPKHNGGGISAKPFPETKSEARHGRASLPLLSFVFVWPEAVGLAVFARDGFVWVAFDKWTSINLAPLRKAGERLVSRMEQLPIGNATVLRMVPARGVSPYVRRDGTNWVVDFKRGTVRPDMQIGIDVNLDAKGSAQMFFPAAKTGAVIHLSDPEVGDLIQVATIKASSFGIQERRAYPEFQILESAQGLAIVGLNDDVELAKTKGGFVLTTPGGLHISRVSPASDVGITR